MGEWKGVETTFPGYTLDTILKILNFIKACPSRPRVNRTFFLNSDLVIRMKFKGSKKRHAVFKTLIKKKFDLSAVLNTGSFGISNCAYKHVGTVPFFKLLGDFRSKKTLSK